MDEDLTENETDLELEAGPEDLGPQGPTDEELLAVAESPGRWLPGGPHAFSFEGEGFAFVASGRMTWVHRLRLTEDSVTQTIDRVEAMLGLKGLDEASWWLSELSTPEDLGARLVEAGFVPDDPPELTALVIDEPPAGEPSVEVRRAETLEEVLQALEIDWEAFGAPEDERDRRRAEAEASWPQLQANDRHATYLAFDDDKPIGFGRVVFTPEGGLLLGGATLPEARGKGVYTALVHARWEAAVERHVPRLIVAAGPLSAPILARLGFRDLGAVRAFRQRL
jgi:GNAT superfamily N-acetyltransferase